MAAQLSPFWVNGSCFSDILTITPTGSPFTFTNDEPVRILVLVAGGTISLNLNMSADGGVNWQDLGLLGGQFILNPGWKIKITYLLAPTMKYTAI